MAIVNWKDYQIRIWSDKTHWVNVDRIGCLQYSRSDQGCGMQCQAEPDSPEYQHVMALCDNVRDAVLALDDYLEGM